MNALMEQYRRHASRTARLQWIILTLALLCGSLTLTAQQKPEMTLAEFRAAVRERIAAAQPPPSVKRGGKPAAQETAPIPPERAADRAVQVFTRLLSAQARKAAERQSQDRLAGWRKAAEARLQAQNTTALDADQLRLAEAQASGSVARFEAARLRAQGEANALLGRPAATPLIAEMAHLTAAPSANQPKVDPSKKIEPSAAPPEPAPDLASRLSYIEKQLLPMSSDLLSKMYQSYQIGRAHV